jgi:DNA-binding transcriptional MerR regulator
LRTKTLDPGTYSTLYNGLVTKETATKALSPGQLADIAGVSTDTLRYYERKGLLTSARAQNGYRRYSEQAVGRVRLIRRAVAIGMTLDQISDVLKVRDKGGSPCRQVRELAAARLKELEEAAREIEEVSAELKALIESWDSKLAQTPNGAPALLLESLPNSALTSQRIVRDVSSARKRGRNKKERKRS